MAEFSLPKNSKIGKGKTYPATGAKNAKTFSIQLASPGYAPVTAERLRYSVSPDRTFADLHPRIAGARCAEFGVALLEEILEFAGAHGVSSGSAASASADGLLTAPNTTSITHHTLARRSSVNHSA